jgi:ketosteroid isomerase-like protein
MNEPEQPILQAIETYRAAVFAKDVDALVALYDPNVRTFDLWAQWSYDGIDAWRAMVAGWFEALGPDRVVVRFDHVQMRVAQDFAVVHAFVTYTGMSAEGQALRSMNNRLTWALLQKSGAWKIVHEHTSVPIDHETTKAILQRP